MAQANADPVDQADLVTLSSNTSDAELRDTNGNMNLHPDTVDYWAALLRKNLSTALENADSDDGDASTTLQIDEEVLEAPRRKSARDALAHEVAVRLYPAPPDSLAPIIKYEKDIVMLRSM